MIELALQLADRVRRFWERVRIFYYEVMLSEHRCPRCSGKLAMIRESWCRCSDCGRELDPTVRFLHCSACGGKPRLSIHRHACTSCGKDVVSRFVFDGVVFNAAYFKQKMADSRQRRREQRERVRQMLAEARSGTVVPSPVDLDGLPDLVAALDGLTADLPVRLSPESKCRFDLNRYQSHVEAHIGPIAISMEEIPPISETPRLDRVWRFIAIIFLAHSGRIDIRQEGQTIMVKRSEAHTKRQGLSEPVEAAGGVERPVGRVEA